MFSHKGFYRPLQIIQIAASHFVHQDIKIISFTLNSLSDQLGRILTGSREILAMTN